MRVVKGTMMTTTMISTMTKEAMGPERGVAETPKTIPRLSATLP